MLIRFKFSVACDGGAASGKTTGAKIIAKKYGLNFLSSGSLYRYAGYRVLKDKPKNILDGNLTKLNNKKHIE